MSKDPDSFKVKMAVLGLIVVAAIFFFPARQRDKLQEQYDELQEQYDELSDKEEDLRYQLGKLEDDMASVYLYFDQDNDISFDEARESYNRIDSVISNIINP